MQYATISEERGLPAERLIALKRRVEKGVEFMYAFSGSSAWVVELRSSDFSFGEIEQKAFDLETEQSLFGMAFLRVSREGMTLPGLGGLSAPVYFGFSVETPSGQKRELELDMLRLLWRSESIKPRR